MPALLVKSWRTKRARILSCADGLRGLFETVARQKAAIAPALEPPEQAALRTALTPQKNGRAIGTGNPLAFKVCGRMGMKVLSSDGGGEVACQRRPILRMRMTALVRP